MLKERGSDLAGSLESKAKDFLNDVKPKVKPPLIPHYESDQDDGSSFGKVRGLQIHVTCSKDLYSMQGICGVKGLLRSFKLK